MGVTLLEVQVFLEIFLVGFPAGSLAKQWFSPRKTQRKGVYEAAEMK